MNTEEKEKQKLSGYYYGLAGATTGTVTRFLVQPLDVLKITFQLQVTPLKHRETAKYPSLYKAVQTIYKEEGVPGLWKGHIPAQFLSIIFGAVQFSSYEKLTSYFHDTHPMYYSYSEHFINIGCGSAAGLAATLASFPFDIIKTHLVFQSKPKIYKGTLDAINKIYKKDGTKGFFRGLTAACIQTAPMSGLVFCFHGIFSQVWFLLYEEIHASGSAVMSTTGSMTTGLLAGLCSKTIVYPFDLMKKRLQIQNVGQNVLESKQMIVCRKISDCFLLTLKYEGVTGLFKGFIPTLIKSGATTSLYFTIYNEIKPFNLEPKLLERSPFISNKKVTNFKVVINLIITYLHCRV